MSGVGGDKEEMVGWGEGWGEVVVEGGGDEGVLGDEGEI